MKPPAYWRQNKAWARWLGQEGVVVASTLIRVAPEGLEQFAPYSFAIIEFDGGVRAEFMGLPEEKLNPGDQVQCVLRKISIPDSREIVAYGIKVSKKEQKTA